IAAQEYGKTLGVDYVNLGYQAGNELVMSRMGLSIPGTYPVDQRGVPVEEIQEGIRHGVRKVNIDTDIRLAMTGAMRRSMAKDKSEFDPRKFLKEATAAARAICKARFEAFGTAGQA
ncbi:class II fructose-bisphosphate aldolase, partial [Acinetobacter baumannii]|uniref:class II fructose-bisphosphate aldolase n=1 Tax=Acinetobacter baumannii TaxID=470 RepID=UPI003394D7FD